MDNQATILEPWKRWTVTGTLVKRYPLGLTIDDENGIRHYATFDRVISQPAIPGATKTYQQGDLFQ